MPKTTQTTVLLRRSPRLTAFLITFALLGLVVTIPLVVILGVAASFAGFVIAFGTALLIFTGWVVYVIFDAIFTRRSKSVAATKIEG